LYVVQVAIGMLVWSLLDERGMGFWAGLVAAVPFTLLAVSLWRARDRFGAPEPATG
jgi:hypothetical protein